MPAVSLYMNPKELEAIRARARAEGVSVSRIVRRAVRTYLGLKERRAARRRVVQLLTSAPLGEWRDVEAERDRADAGRA